MDEMEYEYGRFSPPPKQENTLSEDTTEDKTVSTVIEELIASETSISGIRGALMKEWFRKGPRHGEDSYVGPGAPFHKAWRVAMGYRRVPRIMQQMLGGGFDVRRAVSNDNGDAIREMAAKGVSLDVYDRDGVPPIHHAARRGHMNALCALVECGADVNSSCRGEELYAIDRAVYKRRYEVLEYLIEHGAAITSSTFRWALQAGEPDVLLRKLLALPGAVEAAEKSSVVHGYLHQPCLIEEAARDQLWDAVRVAIECKVNPCSALHSLCKLNIMNAIQAVSDTVTEIWGAEIDHEWLCILDDNEQTLIHALASLPQNKVGGPPGYDDRLPLYRFLRSKGIPIDTMDADGWTPLCQAATCHHVTLMQQLLEDDASVEGYKGVRPLFCAAEQGNAEALGVLLDHGAKVEQRDVLACVLSPSCTCALKVLPFAQRPFHPPDGSRFQDWVLGNIVKKAMLPDRFANPWFGARQHQTATGKDWLDVLQLALEMGLDASQPAPFADNKVVQGCSILHCCAEWMPRLSSPRSLEAVRVLLNDKCVLDVDAHLPITHESVLECLFARRKRETERPGGQWRMWRPDPVGVDDMCTLLLEYGAMPIEEKRTKVRPLQVLAAWVVKKHEKAVPVALKPFVHQPRERK